MPVKVLIVDDSAVVRRVVALALAREPEIDVVGTAVNGRDALARVQTLTPDVITMDVEMPEMDGIAAVRDLRRTGHGQPVIMFSTLTERGAQATFDALAAGATDYLTKPSRVVDIHDAIVQVHNALVPLIKVLAAPRRRPASDSARPAATPVLPRPAASSPQVHVRESPAQATRVTPRSPAPGGRAGARRGNRVDVVAIGSSTGGPEALSTVLSALPATLGVPIVVVQHMPPVFTTQFAQRLDRKLPFTVVETTAPAQLRPGTVHLAPGDFHLEVHQDSTTPAVRTHQGPPESFCRPAVDVLFRSVAAVYGPRALGVVLTGMGSDGRAGAEHIARAGGRVIAQDEETSVVWGMPGAVVGAGLADAVVPLGDIAAAITRAVSGTVVGAPIGTGARA